MSSLDWDDLRYVLAVAREGSLAAAARGLGVNHTTVLRRVGLVEKRLGLRLFDRLPTGYVLTAGGEELIAGWFLLPQRAISGLRSAGVAILLAGVALIQIF